MLLCIWAAGLTLFTGWSWVSIAEKLGGWLLNILTFASNRTRRDDTWVDDEEYDDEYDEETDGVQRESRRARILRGALARRKRLAEKFSNPRGRQTRCRALFRQTDGLMTRTFSIARAASLRSRRRSVFGATVRRSRNMMNYDPLLNGHSVTEPVAAAAAATAVTQTWAASADPIMQTPPMPGAEPVVAQPTVEWQPVPGPQTGEPVIAPAPEGVSAASAICSTAGGRKVRRGSNLCLSLPRRNTPRRQRPQQSMTLLRRRKHSRNGRRRMPNNTGSRSRPISRRRFISRSR
ncbi:DNA translocase ftsK [Salmonella enterica subsp. enterica]|uniref:DNA translocase ftsK n=1 Tax=Salmonella enterica I TaxID=59201 RepID=A0A447PGK3_SALET|nr:DNA translocase ftsK [Salmonella enterica subsp. enterica]